MRPRIPPQTHSAAVGLAAPGASSSENRGSVDKVRRSLPSREASVHDRINLTVCLSGLASLADPGSVLMVEHRPSEWDAASRQKRAIAMPMVLGQFPAAVRHLSL